MEPPFPGMDPYLELPSRWPDVHHRIITAICDQLQERLVPRYIAQITPYNTIETLEIGPRKPSIVPDVGIYEQGVPYLSSAVLSIDVPALIGTTFMQIPTRYARIEIHSLQDDSLVTAIELLSPVNKRPGIDSADAYEKKRQDIFRSNVHLLEIDLLRAGQRPLLAQPMVLPAAPYFIFLSRAECRPEIAIWPCVLQQPLPTVPVPLRYPDSDVPLMLSAVMRQIYHNARYDMQLDYQSAPPPPALEQHDAAWLDAHLRENGLRS